MPTDLIEQPKQKPPTIAAPRCAPGTVRVLHVINGEHYSGAERVQDLLGLRLGEFGFDVSFACLKLGRFAALRQARNAELFDAPMRSRFDARPVAALVQIIRKHNFQIVHTHTARSALVGSIAAGICRVPHVHHLHSPTSLDTTRWLANHLNMAIEKFSLRHADAVIAVSHSLGNYAQARRLGGRRMPNIVPNGVPTQGPLRERATPSGTWTIGSVALFRPRKGLEVLLEAVAKLRARGLPVRLRAVGTFETTEYEVRIKSLADQLKLTTAIDWTGFARNVSGELEKMDLFVLPSLFGEGLPMVILEAMAAGVPVVATRVEGAPEAIRDTLDGLLAEPANADDLAARIADVVMGRIDGQSLRQSAHERQSQCFSDRSMAEGVAAVYDRVLASRSAAGNRPAANHPESQVPSPKSLVLMGTRIDNLTMPEAIDAIKSRLDGDAPTQVCFVNSDCLNITYRDRDYRRVLGDAQLVFADGIGMKIAGKVLGRPVRDNLNGTDLFPRLCMALAGGGKSLYLLGGRPGVAEAVGRWITTHVPRLEVRGTRNGYFLPHEEPAIIAEIAASRADLLLVAFGAPRQDAWIHAHLAETGCRVGIGVGGLFDFVSGRVPLAPHWIRKRGFEWLYRMCQEPRRLARRYLAGNPMFLLRLLRERFLGERAVVDTKRSIKPAISRTSIHSTDASSC